MVSINLVVAPTCNSLVHQALVELEDPVENIGAKLVRQAAAKTNDLAGDGTTTSVVLAQGLIAEGVKVIAAGANPVQITRGIEKTTKALVAELKLMSKELHAGNRRWQIQRTFSLLCVTVRKILNISTPILCNSDGVHAKRKINSNPKAWDVELEEEHSQSLSHSHQEQTMVSPLLNMNI